MLERIHQKLTDIQSRLLRFGIEAQISTIDDELTLQWAHMGVRSNLFVWPEQQEAFFTSYKEGKKVLSKSFTGLSDLHSVIDLVQDRPLNVV